MASGNTDIPKHYADIPLPRRTIVRNLWLRLRAFAASTADIGRHPSKLWHWSAKWPVFGVIVALAVGVTAIGEYGVGCTLIVASAFSLLSKLWHEEQGWFLRSVGSFGIALGLLLSIAVVWDAKGDQDWTRIPHAWHRLMAEKHPATGQEETLPTPEFYHDFQALHQNYKVNDGVMIDGIKWNKDLREFIYTITNGMESGEVSNFKEHLYLQIPVLRIEIISHSGCDGATIDFGNEGSASPLQMMLDKGDHVVRVMEKGSSYISISATRMLPEGQIQIRMIGSMEHFNKFGDPGVMIYGSDFVVNGKSRHYGRMFRYIRMDDNGAVTFSDELHKKGHDIKINIALTFTVDKEHHRILLPMPTPPLEDFKQRTDDN